MKINPIKKLVIAGMGAAMIAAAVGSIGGTVAWFQYNTRATASYTGAAAHCTENLEVRLYRAKREHASSVDVKTDWKHDLVMADIEDFIKKDRAQFAMYDAGAATKGSKTTAELTDLIAGNGIATNGVKIGDIYFDTTLKQNVKFDGSAFVAVTATANDFDTGMYPVTSGGLKEDGVASKLYKNPIEGYCTIDKWGEANLFDYVELPLQFRVLDVTGDAKTNPVDYKYLAKKLYVADVNVKEATVTGKGDISDAIRVAVDGFTTFSKKGEAVVTNGKLDLNGDGVFDQGLETVENGKYHYEGDALTDLVYGAEYVTNDLGTITPTADKVNKALYNTTTEKFYRCEETTPSHYEWVIDKNGQAASTKYEDNKAAADDQKKLADIDDPYNIIGSPVGQTTIGVVDTLDATKYTEGDWFGFNVRVYIEGWQKIAPVGMDAVDAVGNLPAAAADLTRYVSDEGLIYKTVKTSVDPAPETYEWEVAGTGAMWDAQKFIGAKVRIGLGFAAEAHVTH